MEVKIRIADPAGNITIFVTSPMNRTQYPSVANALLAVEEFHGEQVGFIEEKADGTKHMQMMGESFAEMPPGVSGIFWGWNTSAKAKNQR